MDRGTNRNQRANDVEKPKIEAIEQKTGTFAGTFLHDTSNYRKDVARPTGIEPVLRASEALVISFSLRARGGCFVTLDSGSVNQGLTWKIAPDRADGGVNSTVRSEGCKKCS